VWRRQRLSNDSFSLFLQAIKELNSGKKTREDTLHTANDIFGATNGDLYSEFHTDRPSVEVRDAHMGSVIPMTATAVHTLLLVTAKSSMLGCCMCRLYGSDLAVVCCHKSDCMCVCALVRHSQVCLLQSGYAVLAALLHVLSLSASRHGNTTSPVTQADVTV
jgi:hypothetical protein